MCAGSSGSSLTPRGGQWQSRTSAGGQLADQLLGLALRVGRADLGRARAAVGDAALEAAERHAVVEVDPVDVHVVDPEPRHVRLVVVVAVDAELGQADLVERLQPARLEVAERDDRLDVALGRELRDIGVEGPIRQGQDPHRAMSTRSLGHNDADGPLRRARSAPRIAASTEIAAAYREAAKRWHPDRGAGRRRERRMAEINAAYDLVRAAAQHEARGRGGPAAARRRRPPRRGKGGWLIAPLRLALGPELLDTLDRRRGRAARHADVHLGSPARDPRRHRAPPAVAARRRARRARALAAPSATWPRSRTACAASTPR